MRFVYRFVRFVGFPRSAEPGHAVLKTRQRLEARSLRRQLGVDDDRHAIGAARDDGAQALEVSRLRRCVAGLGDPRADDHARESGQLHRRCHGHAVVQLERVKGNVCRLKRAATASIDRALLQPSFDEPNVQNGLQLAAVLKTSPRARA